MSGKPKGSQPDSRNFPAQSDKKARGTNPEGPRIEQSAHEVPPRMPTEHRENSPHHQSVGKKNQGK